MKIPVQDPSWTHKSISLEFKRQVIKKGSSIVFLSISFTESSGLVLSAGLHFALRLQGLGRNHSVLLRRNPIFDTTSPLLSGRHDLGKNDYSIFDKVFTTCKFHVTVKSSLQIMITYLHADNRPPYRIWGHVLNFSLNNDHLSTMSTIWRFEVWSLDTSVWLWWSFLNFCETSHLEIFFFKW